MAGPLVVAVVVNWNGREVLDRCLSTLLAAHFEGLEVAVVDNASSDGSREMVRQSFPSVTLIENERNLGYAGGVNAGLRHALSRGAAYAFLLNNDTETGPDAVGLLVEAMEKRPHAAFAGPMIYYYDPPDVIWSLGGKVSYWTGDVRHIAIREQDTGRYRTVREADYVTGCAMLVRLSVTQEIGFMNETYWMYNEDTDWCVRATERGHSVIVVPEAKVWHRVSMSSGGGLTPYKAYNRLRSTFVFFAIHARWYHWCVIVPATLGRAVAFTVRQVRAGHKDVVAAVFRGARDSVLKRERRLEP